MIHIDIETYSRVNLENNNVYRYSEDEDFTILMAGFSVDDSPVDLVFEDDIYDIPGLWDPDVLKVAHNAAFERVCLSRFKKLPPGTYLPSEEFRDTMAIAAELGLPRSLDGLSKALGVAQKDSAGKTLINFFCKPDRNGNRRKPEDHPEKWLDFCEYCVQDVVSLKEIDAALGLRRQRRSSSTSTRGSTTVVCGWTWISSGRPLRPQTRTFWPRRSTSQT